MFSRGCTLIGALVVFMISACQEHAPDSNRLSDQDITGIHSFFKSHVENALSADWAADALLYTEDVIKFPPGEEPINGRKAVRESLELIDTVIAFTPEIIEIAGCGDIAYVWVKYSLTSIQVDSSEPVASTGKSMMILKRQQDNSWMFHRVMWN